MSPNLKEKKCGVFPASDLFSSNSSSSGSFRGDDQNRLFVLQQELEKDPLFEIFCPVEEPHLNTAGPISNPRGQSVVKFGARKGFN